MNTHDHAEVRRAIRVGAFFQMPMVLVWGFIPAYALDFDIQRMLKFGFTLTWDSALQNVGLTIMIVSMLQIYLRKEKDRLLTTGLFSLTRHPMYHGMFVASLASFFHANLSDAIFWLLWIVYVILTLIAGWFQEQETLARWGAEARIYYDRTPRFIFEWPWFWIRFLPF